MSDRSLAERRSRPFRLILSCLIGLITVQGVTAGPDAARDRWQKGNERYRSGEYAAALRRYAEAEATGYRSGALYFNMGNAYFRLGEIGQAIRYFEKARRLLPERPEIRHNLAVVSARVAEPVPRLPEPFWRGWAAERPGAPALFLWGLAAYVLAVGIGLARLSSALPGKWWKRALQAAAATAVCLFLGSGAAAIRQANDKRGVVVTGHTVLQEAPAAGAVEIRRVAEGVVVHVLETRNDWKRVRLPDGVIGWAHSAEVPDI